MLGITSMSSACNTAPQPRGSTLVTTTPTEARGHASAVDPLTDATAAMIAFGFSPGEVTVTTLPAADAGRLLAETTTRLWSDEALTFLLALSRLVLGDEAAAVPVPMLREHIGLSAMQHVDAFYRPGRAEMVVVEKPTVDARTRVLLLSHELAHAYQDRHLAGGLSAAVDGGGLTLDGVRVRQVVIEGHAQWLGLAAQLKARGRDPAKVDPAAIDNGSVGRVLSGDWALIYTYGGRAALELQRRRGWPAVEKWVEQPPDSTEQLMHPAKLELDTPTEISCRVGEGGRSSVVGELGLLLALLSRGVKDGDAQIASAGWDGDCLAIGKSGVAGPVLWRTLWDRPVDAEQFATVLGSLPGASDRLVIERHGHVVDVAIPSVGGGQAQARALARKQPAIATPPSADAESSAAVERELVDAARPGVRLVSGVARFDAGITLDVPQDWTIADHKGVDLVRAPPRDGWADNVAVAASPDLFGTTLDEVEQSSLSEFANRTGLAVVATVRRKVGGVPVVWLELEGRFAPNGPEIHQLNVSALHRDRVVSIAVTTTQALWASHGPALLAMLEAARWE